MRVLINASNLHVGGGVQVAVSFISELSNFLPEIPDLQVDLIISSVVEDNLRGVNFNEEAFSGVEVFDANFYNTAAKLFLICKRGYSVIFSVFGPVYGFAFFGARHVIGFAQPWIIYPTTPVYKRIPFLKRVLKKFRYEFDWFFFSLASALVVETEEVKRRLVDVRRFNSKKIFVVSNCVSDMYLRCSRSVSDFERQVNVRSVKQFTLGYLCRDYPHKNVDFLLPLGRHLDAISGVGKFRLVVTLNDLEWSKKSLDFKSRVENIGVLRVSECPDFYRTLDGVVFPSQLECFSATPIESMFMGLPVFSSNLEFISNIFGNSVVYIELDDPMLSARIIVSWFDLPYLERSKFIDSARDFVGRLPSPGFRAREYLRIICLS